MKFKGLTIAVAVTIIVLFMSTLNIIPVEVYGTSVDKGYANAIDLIFNHNCPSLTYPKTLTRNGTYESSGYTEVVVCRSDKQDITLRWF